VIYTVFSILRHLICWFDFLCLTAMLYLLSFLPKNLTLAWYPHCFRLWCKLFVRALGVELKLHQKNAHPLPKQYIIIGNHPSAFEDTGMPALFEARFLAKIEVKDWFIFGRISYHAGTLYVKRESKESRKEANQTLQDVLSSGQNIALYPEGGCKGRRIYLPFQYGCFDIAIKTKIPIVPVFLHYEAQESFEWTNHENLVQKIISIIRAPNRTANYYVFDALDPTQFESKENFCQHVEQLYLQWQAKYLE